MVRVVDPTLIVSDVTKFLEFNIETVTYDEMDNIRKSFNIYTHLGQHTNGLTLWFEIEFNKGEDGKVEVKASPWCESTRWTHMTLYFKSLMEIKAGESKQLVFSGKKNHLEGSANIKLKIGEME